MSFCLQHLEAHLFAFPLHHFELKSLVHESFQTIIIVAYPLSKIAEKYKKEVLHMHKIQLSFGIYNFLDTRDS